VNTPRFVDRHLEMPSARVLAALGCKPGRKVNVRVQRQIDAAVDGIRERMACRFAYCTYPMRVEGRHLHVDGRASFHSARLAHALRSCHRLHVYIVTLGADVDAFVDEWMQRRPDFGVVVDAAASAAAESMVDRVEQELAESLPSNLALSLPFSPGYCDWPVTEQQKIFSLLPEGAAGVRLSAHSMMAPRKSISGVFGAGPVAAVTEAGCPCSDCARADCGHRRRPYSGRNNEGFAKQRSVRTYRNRSKGFSVPAPRH
jgi:hypothetical protein